MFGAIARAIKTILNIIVFGFLKKAISGIIASKRLETFISQNPNYTSSLYKVRVLKSL